MSRLIDLELRRGLIWISFPYEPQTTAVIKTLPDRDYHSSSRRWSVPVAHMAIVWQRLEPLHFRFTPRMRDWWKENRDRLTAVPAEEERLEVSPEDGYTIARLNAEAGQTLSRQFSDIWVVAEVDGFARNRPGGHAYFELVDRVGPESVARIRAVLFASARRRIESMMPDDVAFADGARLRLRGRVDVYLATGSYQFVVEGIDVEWAIGARRQKRDEVLERLATEGGERQNLELELPTLPLRIGLITAANSDAYNDFVHELERSGYPFDVAFARSSVQGHAAEREILQALEALGAVESLDVLVITRGGGGKGDLATFDAYAIARAVCDFPVKVISGVGHQRDQSALDFVALSEKTPTAAAQRLVRTVAAAEERIIRASGTIGVVTGRRLETAARHVERLASLGSRHASAKLNANQRRVDQLGARASAASERALESFARRTRHAATKIQRGTDLRTQQARRDVDRCSFILEQRSLLRIERAERAVEDHADHLERVSQHSVTQLGLRLRAAEATLRLADPRRVIERGYALVRSGDGKIVTDAADLTAMASARIEMRDGVVEVTPGGRVPTPETEDE